MKVVNFLRDGIKTNQDVLHSNFDLPKSQVRNKTFCWDIALSFETDMTVWLLGLSKWSCQDLISPTRKKKKKIHFLRCDRHTRKSTPWLYSRSRLFKLRWCWMASHYYKFPACKTCNLQATYKSLEATVFILPGWI